MKKKIKSGNVWGWMMIGFYVLLNVVVPMRLFTMYGNTGLLITIIGMLAMKWFFDEVWGDESE